MTATSAEVDFQPDNTLRPLPDHVTYALENGWADPDKPLKIGHMIHFIRDTEDGCEMRSRFWTGDIEIGLPVLGAFLGTKNTWILGGHLIDNDYILFQI
jgi:hypothetical protein